MPILEEYNSPARKFLDEAYRTIPLPSYPNVKRQVMSLEHDPTIKYCTLQNGPLNTLVKYSSLSVLMLYSSPHQPI